MTETTIDDAGDRRHGIPEGDLATMFNPRSIAIIGASRRADSLGGRIRPILRQHGYDGALYLVNPSRAPIDGEETFGSVLELPVVPDVALVVVGADGVAGVLEECGAVGIRHVVILSSGFGEQLDAVGARRQAAVDAVRRRYPMRVLGPNCEGFLNMARRAALTFSPTADLERALRAIPVPGPVAVVSHSGGLGFALFNDGTERELGFSHVVSTGNECDVDVLDVLELVVEDVRTTVVLCFVEGVADQERFAAIAGRAAARDMALVVAKVGRSAAAARAALAHTAHEVGDPDSWDALMDRTGCVVAADQEDLVDLGLGFARAPRWETGGIAILTISGGAGAWAADACTARGLEVPVLPPDVADRLSGLMPSYGSASNPIDVTAGALSTGGLAEPLEIVLERPEIGAVLLVGSFGGPKQLELEGDALRRVAKASKKPVVVYSYTRPGAASVERLAQAGLAWYPSSSRAARVLAALRR